MNASLDVFYASGLPAWNGEPSWWVLFVTFFVWLAAPTMVMFRAINRHQNECAPDGKDDLRPCN